MSEKRVELATDLSAAHADKHAAWTAAEEAKHAAQARASETEAAARRAADALAAKEQDHASVLEERHALEVPPGVGSACCTIYRAHFSAF